MRWLPAACLAVLLCAPSAVVAAREACPIKRDPAYWAKTPVPPAAAGELTVGSLNLYRLFDHEQDGREGDVLSEREFRARTARIGRYLANDMGAPAVVGLQEVEDETSLAALAHQLRAATGREYRWLLGDAAGNGDIRAALLFDARVRLLAVSSLFDRAASAGQPLHDRLPLVADLDAGTHGRLTVVVLHMKSPRGLDRPEQAPRVIGKRRFQAQELVAWARAQVAAGRRLVVVGDLNSAPAAADDPVGEPLRILLADGALADPAPAFLKPSQRWTYVYRCRPQQLDHVLVSRDLLPWVGGYDIARGDTCLRDRQKCDSRRSVSDHEGVVVRLRQP